jgi:ubiquinone/menaquinone biosynthesis C-methylase UbiE
MKLLPRESLVKTSSVDEADWVYRPLVGSIARMRFRMVLKLLGNHRRARLLEIGYGSGVLLPELRHRCDELHGIDPHPMPGAVTESAERHGVQATLKTSGAESIPYQDHYFDAAIAVSALEFVHDLEAVCREIKRVLKPGGHFVFVTPGTSPILDLGLKLLTGNDAKKDFGNRREIVLPVTRKHFAFEKTLTAPWLVGRVLPLYSAVRGRPLQAN